MPTFVSKIKEILLNPELHVHCPRGEISGQTILVALHELRYPDFGTVDLKIRLKLSGHKKNWNISAPVLSS